VLWPLAVRDREPLRHAFKRAAVLLMRRPAAALMLTAALAPVNFFAAITVVPLLAVAGAYSCLAAAYFTLPTTETRELTWRG